ncbi:MAG: hypothetical protein J0L88_07655 [Xanthomonadales bacterium]|nr:hypothetical protein [Xanthomonadales bacterium]
MTLLRVLVALAALCALAACGGGPVKRVSPPTASVQELTVQADGRWHLLVRVQNFSNVSMRFDRLEATLAVTGKEIGKLSLPIALDIAPASADIVETTLTPAPGSRLEASDFAYELKGRITTSEPKGDFAFERASRLSPVPGLAHTWR